MNLLVSKSKNSVTYYTRKSFRSEAGKYGESTNDPKRFIKSEICTIDGTHAQYSSYSLNQEMQRIFRSNKGFILRAEGINCSFDEKLAKRLIACGQTSQPNLRCLLPRKLMVLLKIFQRKGVSHLRDLFHGLIICNGRSIKLLVEFYK